MVSTLTVDELVEVGMAAFDKGVEALGMRSRPGQREMALAAAQAFAQAELGSTDHAPERQIAVVNAGTGVGKSAAYLLVGAAIAKARGVRLIASSSTVTLQEQLLRDLPRLLGAVEHPFKFVLAKGRGRYLCDIKLDRAIQGEEAEGLFGDEADDSGVLPAHGDAGPASAGTNVELYQQLRSARDADWNGDRDTCKIHIPIADWQQIGADAHSCSGRACPAYKTCAYYAARKELSKADIVVANHALLLASLQSHLLPDLSKALVVLDEAHALPSVAVDQFSVRLDLSNARWLQPAGAQYAAAARACGMEPDRRFPTTLRAMRASLPPLHQAASAALPARHAGGELLQRLDAQVLQQLLAAPLMHTRSLAAALVELGADVSERLKETISSAGATNPTLAKAYAGLGGLLQRLDGVIEAIDLLLTEGEEDDKVAKWCSSPDGQRLTLNACPFLPGELLRTKFWPTIRGAVATSATLTSCGSFDFFLEECGLTRDPAVVTKSVQTPFDYPKQASLCVYHTKAPPTELAAFNAEVSRTLPEHLIDLKTGALVLFTSKAHMLATHEGAPEEIRARILVQGTMPRAALLAEHTRRVREGQPSVVFGLQSFGEGLDLPGDLCSLLVLVKLPFSPPGHPVEDARADYLRARGRDPFAELVVPRTATRLQQWAGRLIRTEEDRGQILIFDSRLITKSYGRRILRGLPPFARREMRAPRGA